MCIRDSVWGAPVVLGLGVRVEDGGRRDRHGAVRDPQMDVDWGACVAVDDGHRAVPGRLVELSLIHISEPTRPY